MFEEEISRREALKIMGKSLAWAVFSPALPYLPPRATPERISSIESANKVGFREDAIITVNGKPEFPSGIFYLPGGESQNHSDEKPWKKVAEAGFNTVVAWWVEEDTLRLAEENNIYTVAYLRYAFPGFQEGGNLNPERLAELARSKSLLAWYGVDEPNLKLGNPGFAFQNELQKLVPGIPLWTNYFDFPGFVPGETTTSLKEYLKKDPRYDDYIKDLADETSLADYQKWWNDHSGTDITGFDIGLADKGGDKFSYGFLIERYYENMRRKRLGTETKAIWVILPAHSEIPRSYESFWFQTIEAVANGATGVFFWDWPVGADQKGWGEEYGGGPNAYSSHWDKIAKVAGQLRDLQAGLVGQTLRISKNKSGKISYKITASETGRYVFAASNIPENGSASQEKISGLPANTFFDVYGEDRRIKTNRKGEIIDNFRPFSAVVYIQTAEARYPGLLVS